ncbi:MAG: hypothetical protein KGI84_04760, partial [Elusimicrobia bacterium]|nr:hypothetical protein [Elusimicrobiota bacterium]
MNALASALALFLTPVAKPCLAADALTPVLWVPEAGFSSWSEFSTDLAAAGSPSLTVAVSPSQLSSAALAVLQPLVQNGEVEIAARIDGDPILPLVADNTQAPRPQDPLDLLSLTHEKLQSALGVIPAGYVPGGGAVSPDLFPAFKSMSLGWVATGAYLPPAGTWAQYSGVALVPFYPLTPNDLSQFNLPFAFSDRGPVVIDEADGLV